MLVAECSSLIRHGNARKRGRLPFSRNGLHGEFQIINYTNETIYAIDQMNNTYALPPEGTYGSPNCVRIQYLIYHSEHNDPKVTQGNRECDTHWLEIPFSAIRQENVFIASLNILLSLYSSSVNVHPNSDEQIQFEKKRANEIAHEEYIDSPFLIIANDPTFKSKYLYVDIHGVICSVQVRHMADYPDCITVAYRDNKTESEPYQKVGQSTFTELREQHPHVWEIGGVLIGDNFQFFEAEHLMRTLRRKEETITVVEHLKSVEAVQELGKLERDRLTQESALYKKRAETAERMVQELKKGNYSEEFIQMELDRLNLQKEELERDRQKLHHEEKVEKQKTQREYLNVAMQTVKVIGTIAPVVAMFVSMRAKKK